MSDLRRSGRQRYKKIRFDESKAYLEANSAKKAEERALDFIEIRPIEDPAPLANTESIKQPIPKFSPPIKA